MGVPVTVAMGNAYYVFFVPMVIAMRMPMPRVIGMPMTMCTGTYTIGKHASRRAPRLRVFSYFENTLSHFHLLSVVMS